MGGLQGPRARERRLRLPSAGARGGSGKDRQQAGALPPQSPSGPQKALQPRPSAGSEIFLAGRYPRQKYSLLDLKISKVSEKNVHSFNVFNTRSLKKAKQFNQS